MLHKSYMSNLICLHPTLYQPILPRSCIRNMQRASQEVCCMTYGILSAKKYSLSEVHFNTGRLLFEFNGSSAARQVFVAFANPVSLLFE